MLVSSDDYAELSAAFLSARRQNISRHPTNATNAGSSKSSGKSISLPVPEICRGLEIGA
jgi:hypothetical protein